MVLVTRITAGWRLESEPREPVAPRQLRALRPWSGSSQRCSMERDDLLYLAAVDAPTTGRRGVQNIGRLDAVPRARPRDLCSPIWEPGKAGKITTVATLAATLADADQHVMVNFFLCLPRGSQSSVVSNRRVAVQKRFAALRYVLARMTP